MSGSDLGKEGFGGVVGVDKLLDIVLGLGFAAGLAVLDNLLCWRWRVYLRRVCLKFVFSALQSFFDL